MVGRVGFGIGAVLLLVEQKMSDVVALAIALVMMPIAAAAVGVIFDKRKYVCTLSSPLPLPSQGDYLWEV
ncbi:MAG: hypothetical protein P8M25_01670 [Paracoccaceae bacterium]|nr:hypothetical protein [Paracoccaceae bacterium]